MRELTDIQALYLILSTKGQMNSLNEMMIMMMMLC